METRSRYVRFFLTKVTHANTFKIGQERFRAPEILFDPEIIGLEYPGIHQIVVDAINRTDLDLRKSLFGNIVLSGGSTLTKGFGDRLLHEVQRLAVKDMRIKIFAPPERKYSTWIGGSILAGLSTFRKVRLFVLLLQLRNAWRGRLMVNTDVGQHRRLARESGHHPHKVHIVPLTPSVRAPPRCHTAPMLKPKQQACNNNQYL